jgi:hypothetical protein
VPKPPGKTASAARPHRQVHLAHREVVEAEGQRRRVDQPFGSCSCGRVMLKPIDDRTGFGGAAIGRLHDARPAAGGDDMVPAALLAVERAAAFRGNSAERPRCLVPGIALAHPRRAEDDDGRDDAAGPQGVLGLLVFEHEARPARRIAEEKIPVERGDPVGGRILLGAIVGHGRASLSGSRIGQLDRSGGLR